MSVGPQQFTVTPEPTPSCGLQGHWEAHSTGSHTHSYTYKRKLKTKTNLKTSYKVVCNSNQISMIIKLKTTES